jgi:hypothetical protein
VVPSDDVLEQHARRVITRAMINKEIDGIRARIEAEAAGITLPNLRTQVTKMLRHKPELPWDHAVTAIAGGKVPGGW